MFTSMPIEQDSNKESLLHGELPSLRGALLIANSSFQESIFKKSIVLILEHTMSGAIGIILNKPMRTDAIFNKYKKFKLIPNFCQNGGPVDSESKIFILYSSVKSYSSEDEEIFTETYLHYGLDILEELQDDNIPFYVYFGYSGWESYQLEDEIFMHAWTPVRTNMDFIFRVEPKRMWRQSLVDVGGMYAYYAKNVYSPFLN